MFHLYVYQAITSKTAVSRLSYYVKSLESLKTHVKFLLQLDICFSIDSLTQVKAEIVDDENEDSIVLKIHSTFCWIFPFVEGRKIGASDSLYHSRLHENCLSVS